MCEPFRDPVADDVLRAGDEGVVVEALETAVFDAVAEGAQPGDHLVRCDGGYVLIRDALGDQDGFVCRSLVGVVVAAELPAEAILCRRVRREQVVDTMLREVACDVVDASLRRVRATTGLAA